MSRMKEKLKALINVGKEFNAGMGERNLSIFATSGCYYMFMSLVPVMMILCCILPFTPYNQDMVLNLIDTYFAPSMGDILRGIANAIYRSNSATLTVSIILTLFSASASMKAVMKGIDAAYKCKNQNSAIVFTVRALVYMVLFVVAILASLIVMVYGGKILMLLRKYLGKVGILGVLLSKGRYVLVMLILFGIFLVFYTLMPAAKVRMKDQIPGAIFGAVVWVSFSAVFTIYISVSNKFGAYGFIGTVMVAMMWMYYCLYFLLIGGYMNSYLTEKKMAKVAATEAEVSTHPRRDTAAEGGEVAVVEAAAEENAGDETAAAGEEVNTDPRRDTAAEAVVGEAEVGTHPRRDTAAEEAFSEETVEGSDENSEDAKPKKKLPLPLIAVAVACAIAAIVGAIFLIRWKKGSVPEIVVEDKK